MFKRIKRILKLSKREPKELEKLEKLDDIYLGDGKAVFIGSGTEEEYKDYENEKKGIKGIFGL